MIFDLQFCTGMAKGIPDLSRMAGIAGLINPSSNCTERLVKEHKYEILQIETGDDTHDSKDRHHLVCFL